MLEARDQLAPRLCFRHGACLRGFRQRPVPLELQRAAAIENADVRRRHLGHPPECAHVVRHVLVGEVGVDRGEVGRSLHSRIGENRLDLTAEHEGRADVAIGEWLLAEPVADQDQPVSRAVVDGDREHPCEALGDVRPPSPVAFDDHLGVGAGAERVAPRFQLRTERREIVDLAIEHERDIAAGIEHRLVRRRRRIDDGKPCVREREAGADVQPLRVWPAIADGRDLPGRDVGGIWPPFARCHVEETGDAAHARPPRLARV